MKKVEKVSIADISFTLDSDAYVSLKQYLDSLHEYYDKDPDGSEIIADIEARIAELILGEQIYTKVISKPLIDTIIAQLGAPEEIDDDAPEGGAAPAAEASIPRRLHRSSEGRILGGVCSGLAKYLDINVVWVRIAFLFPIIFRIMAEPFRGHWPKDFAEGWSWVFFVIYMVLWIALPMARTPRQKLEARGEKITPSSIRQNLQESVSTPSGKKAASVAAEIFTVFGRIVLFFIKFVAAIVGFAFIIAALGIFVTMIAALVNPVAIGFVPPGMVILSPLMLAVLILFCVMMPLFVVGMGFLSLVFNWKLGRIFVGALLGVWLLAVIFCSVVLASNGRYLRDELRERNHEKGYWWPDSWWGDAHDGWREEGRREIRDAFYDGDVEGVSVNVGKDSVVVEKEHGKSDTIRIRKDDSRIEIRRIED